MSALRVLLVDDEPLALDRLRIAFDDMADAEVVAEASDGEAAVIAIHRHRPDLVILDVQMPGVDGLAVARAMHGRKDAEVVFVTAFGQYATDAFDIEAADYLVKPVRFDRLRAAVAKARRRRDDRGAIQRQAELETAVAALRPVATQTIAPSPEFDSEIWVPGRQGLQRVATADINWIEASRDYVLLHTSTRRHILRTTMGALQQRLDPAVMLRVHRSAFVRRDAVASIVRVGKGLISLTLTDGASVQVGPSYTRSVTAAIRQA